MHRSDFGGKYDREELVALFDYLLREVTQIPWETEDRRSAMLSAQDLVTLGMEVAYFSGSNALEAVEKGIHAFMSGLGEENWQCEVILTDLMDRL